MVGRFAHQVTTYFQHYGLVRVEGQPIATRHSWDSYRAISNALLFTLPRHALHHASARRGYDLTPVEGAPMMPHGYMTMFVVALLRPWFRRKIDPILGEWDRTLATPEERRLIADRGWEVDSPAAQADRSLWPWRRTWPRRAPTN